MRTTRLERDPLYNLEKELLFQGLAPATAKAYGYYNKKCLACLNKSPRDITSLDLAGFVKALPSAREQSLAISALKFYFNQILGRRFKIMAHPKWQKPNKIARNWLELAKNTPNPKHLAIIALKYGAKLKTKEIISLEKDDFLAKNSQIIANYGTKQEKVYNLDQDTLKILENWLKLAKNIPNPYLFPGLGNKSHLSLRGIQKILKISLDIK